MNPKVCILRTAGTNCDKETAFAFDKAGGESELVHINQLIKKEKLLDSFQILALPGGFSYGDDLGAGKILANELRFKLIDSIKKFIADGKLIIGVCNGFQTLVKSGILPGNVDFKQKVSLLINDSGKFEARWVYLRTTNDERRTTNCVWTRTYPDINRREGGTFMQSATRNEDAGVAEGALRQGRVTQLQEAEMSSLPARDIGIGSKNLPEIIYLPVAHGEGKFITQDREVLERLKNNRQIVFQYCDKQGNLAGYPDNPNGSTDNIAGICDQTGRVLGLMPHPERHIEFFQHPRWTEERRGMREQGNGFLIFKNGVEYAKRNL